MRSVRSCFCVGLFASLVLAASALLAAESAEFKPFTPKDGRWTISFPGKPEQSTSPTNTELGAVEVHEFIARRPKDKDAYVLIYCDLPADLVKDADPEKLLDRLRDGGAASVHGKPAKENKIKLDGNPGRELEVSGLGGTRLWRLYLVGGRLYQLLVANESGRPSAERAKAFFASFKLAPEPAATTPAESPALPAVAP